MLEYHEIRGIWLCSATAAPDVTFLTRCPCDSECAVPPGLRMGEAPGPAGEKFPFSARLKTTEMMPLFHLW